MNERRRRAYMREYMKQWLSDPVNREKMNKWNRERQRRIYKHLPLTVRKKTGKLIKCVFCGATLIADDGKIIEKAKDHYIEYYHGYGCKNFNTNLEWEKDNIEINGKMERKGK